MPATNGKQVIERMFGEVINQGRLDLIDELFAPEFVSHEGYAGDLGRDAFREFVRGWREAFPDVHCDVSQLLQEGDHLAFTVHATGTHKGTFNGIPATGRSVDFMSMNHAIVRDGKSVEHWVVMDMLTMLTQLGVVPAPGA